MDSIVNHSCSICLGLYYKPIKTKCSHIFCQPCIEELVEFEQNIICPLCRKKVGNPNELKVDAAHEQYIMNTFPQDYAKRLQEAKLQQQFKANLISLIIEYGNTHEEVKDPHASKSDVSKSNKHNWKCYVKLNTTEGVQSDYITKVEFQLHETFAVPLVAVNKPPYNVSRVGWGTFQIPIKIYWKKWLNIPQPTEVTWNLQFTHPEKKQTTTIKINKELLKNIPKGQPQIGVRA